MGTRDEQDHGANAVPPRDPEPETEAGRPNGREERAGNTEHDERSAASDARRDRPDESASSDPQAIEDDPSTAGGPSDDRRSDAERLRGG